LTSFTFMLIAGFFPLIALIGYAVIYLKTGHSQRARYRLARLITRTCEVFSLTRPKIYGKEHIPPEEAGGLFIAANHQGRYDALGVLHAYDYPVSVLITAKQSRRLGVKQVVDLIDGARIERDKPRQQLRVIREIGEKMREGGKFIVFPEGWYDTNRNRLQEFQTGCFLAAFRAHCAIQPVCLYNTWESMNRTHILHIARPEIHILPVIPYEAYAGLTHREVADLVRAAIQDKMREVIAAHEPSRIPGKISPARN